MPSLPMPKQMFGATPPRRISRESTRNDSETVCSWSATNCSEKRPGKLIRWSVAMDPATATRTGDSILFG